MRVLRDFGNIKKSDHDDFIEYEGVFGHEGDCWVESNTSGRCCIVDECVFANVIVYNDARIFHDSIIYDSAQIYCILPVSSFICVYRNALVYGSLKVRSRLHVYEKTKIYCNFKISSNVHVDGGVRVYSNAQVYNSVEISKNSKTYVNALVCDYATIHGKSQVYGHAEVCGYEDCCNDNEIRIGSYVLHDIKEVKKNDVGKASIGFVVLLASFEIVFILMFYVNKYGANNWREGMDFCSFYRAVLHHLLVCFYGENKGYRVRFFVLGICRFVFFF
ncbi:hypothetical protein [Bartonella taylorii]|uniref:hypothetical protein n=1 Tax=Bartonella taylorii TaxID=33046 RepID=UPI001ABAEAA2|nr:hypothetical protein [Bartonella taylorii]